MNDFPEKKASRQLIDQLKIGDDKDALDGWHLMIPLKTYSNLRTIGWTRQRSLIKLCNE